MVARGRSKRFLCSTDDLSVCLSWEQFDVRGTHPPVSSIHTEIVKLSHFGGDCTLRRIYDGLASTQNLQDQQRIPRTSFLRSG